MAFTQADLDELDAEIAEIRTVKATAMSDQSTTYRDLNELLKLRSVMAAEVAASSGTGRTRYAATSKGV